MCFAYAILVMFLHMLSRTSSNCKLQIKTSERFVVCLCCVYFLYCKMVAKKDEAETCFLNNVEICIARGIDGCSIARKMKNVWYLRSLNWFCC